MKRFTSSTRLLSTRELSFLRRCVHTATDDARDRLRALLRETAQPVAVVTAVLPDSRTYHGATLSSFTSIALDPLPLVAFSLRIPSRMASALNAHVSASRRSPSMTSHLVINILAASQPHLAHRFARPDVYPRPFEDSQVPFSLSEDGIPILVGALGALSCQLVGQSLPLARLGVSDSDLDVLSRYEDASQAASSCVVEGEVKQASGGAGLASELFIARVLRVERVPPTEKDERDDGPHRLPLLYHRRRYTTVGTE